MKNKPVTFKILASVLALAGIIFLSAFIYQIATPSDVLSVDEDGSTVINPLDLADYIDAAPTSALTSIEIEGLTYMREEEKLARDVYLFLYDFWGVNIFQNIKGFCSAL